MPEGTEFSRWGIPKSWGKWMYGGLVSILLGLLWMKEDRLDDCYDRVDTIQEKSDKRMEEWLNQYMKAQLQKAEKEKINPKIEEVKEIADSLKVSQ